MRFLVCTLLFFQLFVCSFCFSQNQFNLGFKTGMGFTIPAGNPTFTIAAQEELLSTNAFYSGGVLAQYLLGGKFGIESGFVLNYQSFSSKGAITTFKNYLGWYSSIGINAYQIPLQLVYKFNHRYNPSRYFKIMAGVSLDWITTEYLKKMDSDNSLFTSNLLAGLRIGNQFRKFGRLEFGLEYQYSAWGRYKIVIQDERSAGVLNAKYSVLALNLYYYLGKAH